MITALTTALDLEYGAKRSSSIFTRAEHARLRAHFTTLNLDLVGRMGSARDCGMVNAPALADDTLYREDLSGAFWVRAARRIYMTCSA